ncbi:MAG: flagellar assembly protein FliW [Clostridiales bacterium]
MNLNTKHFGEIEIDEKGILDFPEGLPGFENLKRFIVLNRENVEIPINWLQSIDDGEVVFVIIDPFYVKKDYDFDIDDDEISILKVKEVKDILIYSIVVVPKNIKDMTANLRAPIIINTLNKKGKQVVLHNTEYEINFKIFKG